MVCDKDEKQDIYHLAPNDTAYNNNNNIYLKYNIQCI